MTCRHALLVEQHLRGDQDASTGPEAQIALPELARRLENPGLVADPLPYRENPVLRGPRHLFVEFDRVTA
jgi:hypothetical protein